MITKTTKEITKEYIDKEGYYFHTKEAVDYSNRVWVCLVELKKEIKSFVENYEFSWREDEDKYCANSEDILRDIFRHLGLCNSQEQKTKKVIFNGKEIEVQISEKSEKELNDLKKELGINKDTEKIMCSSPVLNPKKCTCLLPKINYKSVHHNWCVRCGGVL